MRWDGQRIERDEAAPALPGLEPERLGPVRTFDAPEAMGIRFHEVRARSALNHVPGGNYGFNWTVNPYRGCTHACVYCFARPTHTYLDFNAGRDFEKEIVVKVNVPEVLRSELARSSWRGEKVALGTNTDPYQWVESRYGLTRDVLLALEEAVNPVSVLTKSPLVLRDLEIFERMGQRNEVQVNLSIPTLDEKAWRSTEPHTPSPKARLEAVAELRRRGISSGILIAPLMPGVNDSPEQVEPILAAASEAGAEFATPIALHLKKGVREVFFAWLRKERPDLVPRYSKLYPKGRARLTKEQSRAVTASGRGWGSREAFRQYRDPARGTRSEGRPGSAPPEAPPDPGQSTLF